METITYDSVFGSYWHEGSLVIDLEKLIATILNSGKEVNIEVQDV